MAFIWLMQKWRQMSVLPHNEWKPSILAAAAAHQQSVSAAAAAAAALAALAAPASSPVELGSITEAAPVLKHKKLPLPLGVSLTSMVAAAGGVCLPDPLLQCFSSSLDNLLMYLRMPTCLAPSCPRENLSARGFDENSGDHK